MQLKWAMCFLDKGFMLEVISKAVNSIGTQLFGWTLKL